MKRYVLVIVLLLTGLLLWAGDIATFQNLGFSGDSRYFMFGQYGVSGDDSSPYADLFLVDVARNSFVSEGRKNIHPKRTAEAFDSGIGALFALVQQNTDLASRYHILPYVTGRPLYILLNGKRWHATKLKHKLYLGSQSYLYLGSQCCYRDCC